MIGFCFASQFPSVLRVGDNAIQLVHELPKVEYVEKKGTGRLATTDVARFMQDLWIREVTRI